MINLCGSCGCRVLTMCKVHSLCQLSPPLLRQGSIILGRRSSVLMTPMPALRRWSASSRIRTDDAHPYNGSERHPLSKSEHQYHVPHPNGGSHGTREGGTKRGVAFRSSARRVLISPRCSGSHLLSHKRFIRWVEGAESGLDGKRLSRMPTNRHQR